MENVIGLDGSVCNKTSFLVSAVQSATEAVARCVAQNYDESICPRHFRDKKEVSEIKMLRKQVAKQTRDLRKNGLINLW